MPTEYTSVVTISAISEKDGRVMIDTQEEGGFSLFTTKFNSSQQAPAYAQLLSLRAGGLNEGSRIGIKYIAKGDNRNVTGFFTPNGAAVPAPVPTVAMPLASGAPFVGAPPKAAQPPNFPGLPAATGVATRHDDAAGKVRHGIVVALITRGEEYEYIPKIAEPLVQYVMRGLVGSAEGTGTTPSAAGTQVAPEVSALERWTSLGRADLLIVTTQMRRDLEKLVDRERYAEIYLAALDVAGLRADMVGEGTVAQLAYFAGQLDAALKEVGSEGR